MDAERAEAYADTVEVDHEEQPEKLPQEAHACVTSQAKSALSARCATGLGIGDANVY